MMTITALKWVPPFAQGQVRDLRVRWMLEEAGWPYEVRLLDAEDQASAEYRAQQPFGQVPVLEHDGVTLFESGAIILHVSTRMEGLWPADEHGRARALAWLFAALNTIEPALANLAEVDFFMRDEALKAKRRPGVVAAVEQRLAEAAAAFDDVDYVAGDFSGADVILSSVLRIVGHTDLLAAHPRLAAYKARCEARPAFQRALAAQCSIFAEHGPAEMKYPREVIARFAKG